MNPVLVTPRAVAAPPPRLLFVDWLRIAAIGLLVVYHVGMVYVPWDYHVKSLTTHPSLEPWMRLSSPWRMGLLFVVSGIATGSMLGRPGLARERSRRLLLPLAFGMLVVVPPQPYFEVVQKLGYDGGWLAFLRRYYGFDTGFCPDGRCLVLPTWNHLWFLPYLWCYTVLLLAALRWLPASAGTAIARGVAALSGAGLIVVPVVVLGVFRLWLFPRFGSTHTLVDDVYNHACYLLQFGFGVVAARRPALFTRMEAVRWPALGCALACWLVLNLYLAWAAGRSDVPDALRAVMRFAFAGEQWAAVVAAFGFARRHLNRDHRWRAALTEAVFPLYVLHQTIIVATAFALRQLAWPDALQAPLIMLLTVAGGVAGWRLARCLPALQPCLGIGRIRATAGLETTPRTANASRAAEAPAPPR